MTNSRTPQRPSLGCILFDWGDTLMRDFPAFPGPMADWPRVEAMPGAVETLALLRPHWKLALATNAADSEESQIWRALARVGLDDLLDHVYCYRRVGVKKPALAFFAYILDDLGLPARQVYLVGDDFQADIQGALNAGLRAIWYQPEGGITQWGETYATIQSLSELPAMLEKWSSG